MKDAPLFISAGYVVRHFFIDYPNDRRAMDLLLMRHDRILDALVDEANASSADSGHTGFNVRLTDDTRSDAEIIQSLAARMEPFLVPPVDGSVESENYEEFSRERFGAG